MPYSDPEKKRENQRRWYAEKLRKSKEFREQEAIRKAEWLQTFEGKMLNAEASARYRETLKSRKRKKPK
jgi:hypothetical protein